MTKKVTGKDLKKLIESALIEDLSINLPTEPRSINKRIKKTRKALDYDEDDTSIINQKVHPKIYKTTPYNKFDYDDTQAFGQSEMGASNPFVQRGVYDADEKKINVSSENIKLMTIFLDTDKKVWKNMSAAEKRKFEREFLVMKNFGFLKQVPVFIEKHRTKYDALVQQIQTTLGPQAVTQTVADDPSITSPNIQTALGDKAQMTQEQKNYFDRFFALNNTGSDLKTRLQALTKFSALIANADGKDDQITVLKNQSMDDEGEVDLMKVSQNFIVNIGVLDMFNNFAKNIDHGAGAYFFETFLAYIAGGQSGGKLSGIAGGMGEADFLKADGTKGSAKYLAKGGTVAQSYKNFIEGFPVEYVIAFKSDAAGKKTSQVEDLYKIDLFKAVVEKLNPEQISVNGTTYSNDDLGVKGIDSDIDIALAKSNWETIGSFLMPQTNSKTLTQFAEEAAKSVDDSVEKTFKEFKTLIDDLKQLKTLTQEYATNPTIPKGSATLEKSEQFDTNLKKLGTSYGQTLSETLQKEQIITSNFLKKIIEESFKK